MKSEVVTASKLVERVLSVKNHHILQYPFRVVAFSLAASVGLAFAKAPPIATIMPTTATTVLIGSFTILYGYLFFTKITLLLPEHVVKYQEKMFKQGRRLISELGVAPIRENEVVTVEQLGSQSLTLDYKPRYKSVDIYIINRADGNISVDLTQNQGAPTHYVDERTLKFHQKRVWQEILLAVRSPDREVHVRYTRLPDPSERFPEIAQSKLTEMVLAEMKARKNHRKEI